MWRQQVGFRAAVSAEEILPPSSSFLVQFAAHHLLFVFDCLLLMFVSQSHSDHRIQDQNHIQDQDQNQDGSQSVESETDWIQPYGDLGSDSDPTEVDGQGPTEFKTRTSCRIQVLCSESY